jgi:phosphatidylserine decarboxylase
VPERLRPFAYRAFARAVGANLEETELALDAYPSFGDFFARRLRDGARVVDPTRSAIISPCDGVVAARGQAVDGVLVQAKGHTYTLGELLADEGYARGFVGGEYVTIYLSPRDYHRVHAPVTAGLEGYDYLPGALWPVNPRVASRRAGLFARNERVVIRLNSPLAGDVAVVMVGAAGVGNIALHHGPTSASLRGAGERRRVELSDIGVARGDELGAFRLGSTVVMVFGATQAKLSGRGTGGAIRRSHRKRDGGPRGKRDDDSADMEVGMTTAERRRRRRRGGGLRVPSDNVPRRTTPPVVPPVPEDPSLAMSIAYSFSNEGSEPIPKMTIDSGSAPVRFADPQAPEPMQTVIDPPSQPVEVGVDFEMKTREMNAVDLEALGLHSMQVTDPMIHLPKRDDTERPVEVDVDMAGLEGPTLDSDPPEAAIPTIIPFEASSSPVSPAAPPHQEPGARRGA